MPKESKDTTSCGTTYSGSKAGSAQDIVPQDNVPIIDSAQEVDSHPDHSAIAEGVSQIFRRKKGGAPTKGFRCTSGPRKGRIVAKPSTCFMKTDPNRSAKIRKKRGIKAKITGKKLAQQKRTGAGSKRLQGVQIGGKRQGKGRSTKGNQPRHGRSTRSGKRSLQKSKTIKPRR